MTDELMVAEPAVLILGARVLIAALLGAALGLEREWRGKEAGLRTNTIIAIGAALFAAVSVSFTNDPARVAAQVVSGVGFLGAGAILRNGGTVQGLTTAAMIWVNAAVGVACGVGYIRLAALATGIVLVSMFALSPIDRYLDSRLGRRRDDP